MSRSRLSQASARALDTGGTSVTITETGFISGATVASEATNGSNGQLGDADHSHEPGRERGNRERDGDDTRRHVRDLVGRDFTYAAVPTVSGVSPNTG